MSAGDAKYLPQGEDIFSCTKCKVYFVLPSCCDHYQENKIQEIEAFKKEALELISDLTEDILTPHRLGLAKEPINPQWVSFNSAREFLKKHQVKE